MDTKIKISVGDLIINKESNYVFLIIKSSRHNISIHQTRGLHKALTFDMSRTKLIEQLTSERGKEVLVHYPVKNVKV